jgi:hypothetical protein
VCSAAAVEIPSQAKEELMQKCSLLLFTVIILLLMPFVAMAEDKGDSDDDTLKHYLSKSDAVVVGKVTAGPQRLGVDSNSTPARVIEFRFKVLESIKGKIAEKQRISVTEIRALDIGLSPPEQGQKLVLFLKSSGGALETADKWFGVRPYSGAFVEQLKRVASEAEPPGESP